MKQLEKTATLVALGSWGYPLIEILWRGWTHWSMALAGGVCLSLLGRASRYLQDRNLLLRCAAGSGIITTVELLFGCIFNLGLHLSVWDYSAERWNLAGQICARYSTIWFLLSGPLMRLTDYLCADGQQERRGEKTHAACNQYTKFSHHIGVL